MTEPDQDQEPAAPKPSADQPETGAQDSGTDDESAQRVVVVTPEGMGVVRRDGEQDTLRPADLVEQPAKVMRLASMIKHLLEEVRNAPLDEASRQRLAEVHRRSLTELEEGLSQELVDELERITLPFGETAPSEAELRVAQAQLVGWLEGLFHGIQTAIVAQQMAAQAQLQQMRRALPGARPGMPTPGAPGMPRPAGDDDQPTGQYL